MNFRKNQKTRRQRGTVMVEYGLLLAGILVVGAAAVSILGHKTNDLIATAATILPGAHEDDNAPIASGKIIETGPVGPDGSLAIDADAILDATETSRLGTNTGIGDDIEDLVVEVGD